MAEVNFDHAGDGGEGEVVGVGAEGFFDFVADGVEAEEGEGDEEDDEGGGPTGEGDDAEGEGEAVDGDDAVDEDGVGVGDGGGLDAFAAALDIGEGGEGGFEGGEVEGVDPVKIVGFPKASGECVEDGDGGVVGDDEFFDFGFGEEGRKFGSC